jgi:hypothetical protein
VDAISGQGFVKSLPRGRFCPNARYGVQAICSNDNKIF